MKSENRDARADDRIREALERLRQRDFVVVHGLEQDGDVVRDHLVSGPAGVFYVVTGRRRDDEQLRETWRRAEELCRELDTWVTPVICRASRLGGKPQRRERVWIVPRRQIADWIAGRRNPVLASECVAQLADRLRAYPPATPAPAELSSVSTALLDRARAGQVDVETEDGRLRRNENEQSEPV